MSDWTGNGTAITTSPDSVWTLASLTSQIKGELAGDYNEAGGATPARLTSITYNAYRDLWNAKPWRHRRRRSTFTIAANANTAALPAAFAKFDQQYVQDTTEKSVLSFFDNGQAFDDAEHAWTTTGVPQIALIEPASDLSLGYSLVVRVCPTANAEFVYPYLYLCKAPDLGGNDSPLWPQPFHEGWMWLAKARSFYAFRRNNEEAWRGPLTQFKHWMENADEHDENLTNSTPVILDAMGDTAAFAGAGRWLGTVDPY